MELPMCRLCLAPNSGCTELFDTRTRQPNVLLLQKVVECTSIKLTVEDDCPSSVCGHCVGKLNELSAFKIQCIVNNDFYREKQAELRKQLIASLDPEFAARVAAAVANQNRRKSAPKVLPPTSEVVCLDDDEDELETTQKPQHQQQQQPEQLPKQPEPVALVAAARVAQPSAPVLPVQKSPAKIVEQIVIDDDEDETTNSQQQQHQQPTSTITISAAQYRRFQATSSSLNYGNNEAAEEKTDDVDDEADNNAEDFPLDDYELVEGQEVDDLQELHQHQQYLAYQQEQQHMLNNGAILTSILLDDEEDSSDGLLQQQQQSKRLRQYFECHVCQREFTAQSKLELHLKQHSQNRLKCFICGKWVVLHLLRHLRSQHPGQQFPEPVRCWHNKCAHVQEVFYGVDQLLAHMDAKRTYRK